MICCTSVKPSPAPRRVCVSENWAAVVGLEDVREVVAVDPDPAVFHLDDDRCLVCRSTTSICLLSSPEYLMALSIRFRTARETASRSHRLLVDGIVDVQRDLEAAAADPRLRT